MNPWIPRIGLAAACAAILGGATYVWWLRQQARPVAALPPAAAPAVPAPAAPPAASAPAILHPVPADAAVPVPPDRIDDAVVALIGKEAALNFLQLADFPRRIVVTVDNLGRAHAAPALWPVNPAAGRFSVDAQGDAARLARANAQRYAAFVQLVERVDAARAVELYFGLYPQFQQAYEELGYPGRYFNDRLIEVIDLLLATPEPAQPPALRLTEVQGPVKPTRPWVHYEFVDPALQALPAGQKMLIRMGPDHERRLKARLREFRRQLLTGPTPAGQ